MIPEIYAEMSIVFENDFDVSVISKLLNISPHEFQSQSNDTKVSPITNKKLEGFWTIRSDIFHEFDLKVATDNLIHPVDAILREMSLLDSEERFKKAFLYLCAVGTGITEFETDGINQEDIENIRSKNGTGYYTRICLDEGIIDARMNSDSRYCFIMGEPEEGLAKGLCLLVGGRFRGDYQQNHR